MAKHTFLNKQREKKTDILEILNTIKLGPFDSRKEHIEAMLKKPSDAKKFWEWAKGTLNSNYEETSWNNAAILLSLFDKKSLFTVQIETLVQDKFIPYIQSRNDLALPPANAKFLAILSIILFSLSEYQEYLNPALDKISFSLCQSLFLADSVKEEDLARIYLTLTHVNTLLDKIKAEQLEDLSTTILPKIKELIRIDQLTEHSIGHRALDAIAHIENQLHNTNLCTI